MSYARFLDNDVYVFLHVGGFFTCCACGISDWPEVDASPQFRTTDELIKHLREHQERSDRVEDYVFENLERDREENDQWIANYKPDG